MEKGNDSRWIDPHLRFSIANACKKSEDEITQSFLLTLRELNLSDKAIRSLEGLEYAKNLNNLILNKNYITNADTLSNLSKLNNIELNENRIEDINFLTSLVNLRTINLSNNNIKIVPNLYDLKRIQLINLSNNRIEDFSFIDSLYREDTKVVAKNQFIYLKPISINYNEDYEFKPILVCENENIINYGNIQVSGEYKDIITNKIPYFEYSLSKALIKNITSNCLIRASFYHELLFYKASIISGTIVQPVILKSSNIEYDCEEFILNSYSISGKLTIEEKEALNNKLITIIDSKGNKRYSITDNNGVYKFDSLKEDRYTLLFPFLSDYDYISPSLYIINLKNERYININGLVSLK